MESSESTNQLLEGKYKLAESGEVKKAAEHTRRHTGQWPPRNPLARIQNYLDRLSNILDPSPLEGHPHFDRKERNLEMIKHRLYDKFVVKPEKIPEGFWENQRRIIRERGQGGDLERVDWEELKRQNTEAIISDQRASLDKWVDYFASTDSSWIPDSLKYYAFRSILSMNEYDKEKKVYPQRSKGTTKPFPDLNREALSYVLDALNKKYQQSLQERKALEQQRKVEGRELTDFETLLEGENFAKLYAWAIEKVTPASAEQLAASQGAWVKYNQGSDHMTLVRSLQGQGTGWCTAGESTAQAQLRGGDFYVYYSLDQDGKPTIPRAAIRMEEGRIAEVRGISADQNLDAGVTPVVEEKLKEFPDGESYKKRVHDMEFLTAIEHKVQDGKNLNSQELAFLYEINSPIEGFGFSKDPRIAELRSRRNTEEDILIVLGCKRNQIAHTPSQIRTDTKAYVGPLQAGIFDLLARYNIDQIYTSLPEGKIRKNTVEIGGKTARQLETELIQRGVNISEYAKDMLYSPNFTTLAQPQSLDTVRLKVQDLGLSGYPTTDQIYQKAQELGLELCPAEVGPHLRLKDSNQSMNEWYWIAMKQIPDSSGRPSVFGLKRDADGLWLNNSWAFPDDWWGPEDGLVFSLRKSNPQSLKFFDRIFRH